MTNIDVSSLILTHDRTVPAVNSGVLDRAASVIGNDIFLLRDFLLITTAKKRILFFWVVTSCRPVVVHRLWRKRTIFGPENFDSMFHLYVGIYPQIYTSSEEKHRCAIGFEYLKASRHLKHCRNRDQCSLEFQRTSKIPFCALLLRTLKVQKAPGGVRTKVILESDIHKC